MNVVLRSSDHNLEELCRQIIASWPSNKLQLCVSDTLALQGGDIIVWDHSADNPVTPYYSNIARHLVLIISKEDLGQLPFVYRNCPLAIVLKPINKIRLELSLEQALLFPETGLRGETVKEDHGEILECLLQTNVKLQNYDQERTRFLARTAHDFRSPLASIGGYCELLLDGKLGSLSSTQMKVLRGIKQSADRLLSLSSGLLQLSVGREFQTKPQLQAGSLFDCITHVIDEMGPRLRSKDLSIVAEMMPDTGLSFDRSNIEQVLSNLLDNAIKFAPRSSRIIVKAYTWTDKSLDLPRAVGMSSTGTQRRNSFYRVDVIDQGPGLPGAQAERIFDDFESASPDGVRSSTGLGLAICRTIVELHGGQIWAEPNAPATMLSFTLPLALTGPPEDVMGPTLCASHPDEAINGGQK